MKKIAAATLIALVLIFSLIEGEPNAFEAYESGDYLASAQRFETLENRQGDFNAANAYYKAGEYEKALMLYQNVRSSDPLFKSKLYFNMANCLIRLQEFEKAREHFRFSLLLHYDRAAVENLHFIATAEEQDHMLSGRQKGKKRAEDSAAENSSQKEQKSGGGSNQQSEAERSKGSGNQGKKSQNDPRLSFSPKGKSRLSSKQYELINSRSIYETQPW
ncbi:MAG: hypothetical protein DRG24_06120 [Epsilonproteobacteria bacterium]|nr:MAG: hypothetical protein DRG24_06120 [Campylobacterota bacterium]